MRTLQLWSVLARNQSGRAGRVEDTLEDRARGGRLDEARGRWPARGRPALSPGRSGNRAGADELPPVHPAVHHGCAEVRAELPDGEDVVAVPEQDQTHAGRLHPLGLTRLEHGLGQQRRPLTGVPSRAGPVDPDAQPVHQTGAEIVARRRDAVTHGAGSNATDVPTAPAIAPRQDVQRGRHGVQRPVDEPDAPGLLLRVLPVVHARRCRSHAGEDPDTEADPGRLPQPRLVPLEAPRRRPGPPSWPPHPSAAPPRVGAVG